MIKIIFLEIKMIMKNQKIQKVFLVLSVNYLKLKIGILIVNGHWHNIELKKLKVYVILVLIKLLL